MLYTIESQANSVYMEVYAKLLKTEQNGLQAAFKAQRAHRSAIRFLSAYQAASN